MSFWFTPVGIILPIVLYVLPIIVYRFFILKKSTTHKKATIISIIYFIVSTSLIAIISNEEAFFQAIAYVVLAFLNYRLLAGENRSKSIRAWGKFQTSRRGTSLIGIICLLPFVGLLGNPNGVTLILLLIIAIFFSLFHFLRYEDIKKDVESDIKWQEKLERERLEREQKELKDDQNPLSKKAKRQFKCSDLRVHISPIIYAFLFFLLWIVYTESTTHLFLLLAIPFAVLLFFLFKYRQIEDDVEAAREWQEKLDRERLEREQKDKDGR